MTRWAITISALTLLGSSALAAEPDEEGKGVSVERVTGKQLPPLKRDVATEARSAQESLTLQEYMNREFEPEAYLGAEMLDMTPKQVHGVRAGLELLYLRDYKGAKEHFAKLDKEEGLAVGAVADTLVWQALMLENFDFKYDKQYWVSTAQARKDLEAALAKPGAEGFEYFLLTGISGIEAIHTMRQGKYISALQLAFEAMDNISKVREKAPKFTDMQLADGMYNYWRTAVTMNSSVLPDFGDHRAEGIEQVQTVARSGVLLAPAATLSMAFTWLEEGNLKNALTDCNKNRRAYPDNVINNLVTGTTYVYMRNYDSAIGVFNEILEDAPDNQRVLYWRGRAYLQSGRLDQAEADLNKYIQAEYLEDYHRAMAHYRLGQVYNRKKQFAKAEEAWKTAIKIDKNKASQKALDRLRQRKKEGKIDY